ncbi:Group 1 glycosyl transferase [Beijerinckiaceae bacterium RH AL1]|nr:glycosyltransferase [Beijerinckiaceae bacterium]VVB42820.1 Group 1 glycosyl transferase [Beijerinckiaceae bacterium RH AL8]VVB42831.1 Group 1 glycosyl transferase [Beijerinckiaceae bacterium RH CH11]VVC53523.1 Group 1 glycosyl transferase [Beijerinckiaceae bacterium RH AL1]
MGRPVCYDVTRLLTRILNATPNGIDRIDHALATHFLAGEPDSTFGATATGVGARLLPGPAAAEAAAAIAAHWGETRREVDDDPAYRRVVAWLTRGEAASGEQAERRPRRKLLSISPTGVASWARRHGAFVSRTPRAHLPLRSVYLNASQFPLWVAGSFEWLELRPDIAATFFVHDLLPVLMPEYFRAGELPRHRARLKNLARFAAGAIVTTPTVADDLAEHMAQLGRRDMPVFVAPTPIAPIFSTPREIVPALGEHPYFVLCSTLEPRKNHLMILAVWRALVARLGAGAPKLLLVGTRGWHYDPIIDLIARSPALATHVMEVSGLSSPGLKRLIDNARALLMPTFGEGYGLPVHEALAAGAPVIASDIPVFRWIEHPLLTRLSPLDGEAWLDAIAQRSRDARPPSEPAPGERLLPDTWTTYFARLTAFLEAL